MVSCYGFFLCVGVVVVGCLLVVVCGFVVFFFLVDLVLDGCVVVVLWLFCLDVGVCWFMCGLLGFDCLIFVVVDMNFVLLLLNSGSVLMVISLVGLLLILVM